VAKEMQVEVQVKNVRTEETRKFYLTITEDGMLSDANILRLLTRGAEMWGAGWDVSEFSVARVSVRE
jgi:hypothetical protein